MAGVGHLFLALRPPPAVLHELAARLQAAFSDMPVPGTRVEPELWHVTLRFLGDIGDVGRDRLVASLDEADLGPPVRVALGGLGAFPNPARANVLWVGVGESPALAALVAGVEDACVAAGREPEGRPFVGHLTISRMRPAVEVWPWLEREPDLDVAWRCGSVELVASHRRRTGLAYETLDSFALG